MEGARYLEDGKLVIFKRSGIFYARIRSSPAAKYIWRSLKTTDEQTAIRAGRKLFYSLEHRLSWFVVLQFGHASVVCALNPERLSDKFRKGSSC